MMKQKFKARNGKVKDNSNIAVQHARAMMRKGSIIDLIELDLFDKNLLGAEI